MVSASLKSASLKRLGREARVQKAQNDVQVGHGIPAAHDFFSQRPPSAEVGRLERALKERNGIETERRRAESKLKVLETQRDVDIQTLQDHQEEIRGLKLQLSARVEQETVVQSAHTKPNKESSTGVAVWQKARVFEERIHGKSEAKQATKTNPEDPKSGDGNRDDHNDCGFIVRECRASPRSPNSQMREKLAKAVEASLLDSREGFSFSAGEEQSREAHRGEDQGDGGGGCNGCTFHLPARPASEAKDAEPETEPKPEAWTWQGGAQNLLGLGPWGGCGRLCCEQPREGHAEGQGCLGSLELARLHHKAMPHCPRSLKWSVPDFADSPSSSASNCTASLSPRPVLWAELLIVLDVLACFSRT